MRITFCGENSAEFVRDDIVDICRTFAGTPVDVTLHDPDAGRLAHAVMLAREIVAQLHAAGWVRVRPVSDLGGALEGADFVVCELEPGGIEAVRRTARIAARHGLRIARGDTAGIAGIIRGLRTVPAMLRIARTMAARCPDAFLLTYTNPMAMATWAVRAGSELRRTVGLCHAVHVTERLVAQLVAVEDPAAVSLRVAGMNHLSFVLDADCRGVPIPLDEAARKAPPGTDPLALEILQRFGYLPVGTEAEFFPWIMRDEAERQRLAVCLDQYDTEDAQVLAEMAEDDRRIRLGEPLDVAPASALAARVVRALASGRTDRLHATVPNDDLIGNLPTEAAVEVPCVIHAGRILPEPVGALPPQLAALIRPILCTASLTVQAVLEDDPRHVYQAAMLDPATAGTLSMTSIAALCDDLLADQLVTGAAFIGSPAHSAPSR